MEEKAGGDAARTELRCVFISTHFEGREERDYFAGTRTPRKKRRVLRTRIRRPLRRRFDAAMSGGGGALRGTATAPSPAPSSPVDSEAGSAPAPLSPPPPALYGFPSVFPSNFCCE